MAHIELSTEEIQVALEWYASYPKHPTPVEKVLTEKLEAALPVQTVDVALSNADIRRIFRWANSVDAEKWEESEDSALVRRLMKAKDELDAARNSL